MHNTIDGVKTSITLSKAIGGLCKIASQISIPNYQILYHVPILY